MASLHDASASGDIDGVRSLLANGADVNEVKGTLPYIRTPLAIAAANGHLAIVHLLLQANADVDAELAGSGTALLHACDAGQVASVEALLTAGADYRTAQRAYRYQTPLLLACSRGNTAVAELLLDAGEELNPCPPGQYTSYVTPLYVAAADGSVDTIAMLLSRGADVNAISRRGPYEFSPLYAATICNIEEYTGQGPLPAIPTAEKEAVRDIIFKQLVDAGVYLNDDPAAFHQAASLGQTNIVRAMIKAGMDVNRSRHGNPLAAAAGHGHLEIVSMLLRAGADVNHLGDEDPSALLQAVYHQHEAIVRLLLEAGADLACEASEYQGYTPLRLAASEGMSSIVSLLLAGGAAVDYEPRDPLMYDLAEEGGAEPPDEPPTPLCLAARNKHIDIVDILIRAGADVNAAIQCSRDETARLLMRRKAIVETLKKDESSLT